MRDKPIAKNCLPQKGCRGRLNEQDFENCGNFDFALGFVGTVVAGVNWAGVLSESSCAAETARMVLDASRAHFVQGCVRLAVGAALIGLSVFVRKKNH